MIFEYILNGSSASFAETAIVIVFMAVIAFLSIMLREYVRACVTVKLGGEAEKTLNPLKTLTGPNIFSVIVLALFSVSWIKPKKPVLSAKNNALIALAGPLTSIVIALASMFIYDILYIISVNFYVATESNPIVLIWISMFFSSSVLVNIAYALFGLLPIPGTDGGLLIAQLFPEKVREKFLYFDKFSYVILLFIALIASRSGIAGTVLNAVASTIETPFLSLMSLIFPVSQ